MGRYIVRAMSEAGLEGFAAGASPFSPTGPCDGLNRADISYFPWDANGYRPEASAWVGWGEAGLYVIMASREARIRCLEDKIGGSVCVDSCLEFFLTPSPDRGPSYVNVEVNPCAVSHVGVGDGRHGRYVYDSDSEGFGFRSQIVRGEWWSVSYALPARFLRERFGAELRSGLSMRGNFYKCGDGAERPHWGMWSPYDLARADFHRPELFADITLE